MPFSGHGTFTELENIGERAYTDARVYLLPQARALAARLHTAKRAARIECALFVAMQRHIQYGWIVVEGPLSPIPCERMGSCGLELFKYLP
jgi:hypothetical protein